MRHGFLPKSRRKEYREVVVGDITINATEWSPDGESILLYRIKNILNNDFDFNLIKTRMYQGRRSVQHCLRPAKKLINNIEDSKKIFIYNSSWDVRPANLDWNEYNRAEFNIHIGCEL